MAKFCLRSNPAKRQCGFSLIELSVVVAIMAIVAVAGLEGAASLLTRSAYGTTQEKLATLDAALVQFFRANGRLPCPAVYSTLPAAAPASIAYGFEDCSIAVLAGTGPPALPGGGVVVGAFPFRALNLPMDAAMDGYGSKLFYYVTKNLTAAGSTVTGQFAFRPVIASATIAGAANNSGLIQITVGTGLSTLTNDNIIITGAASGNGSYLVTRSSATVFDLQGSNWAAFNNTIPGGIFQPTTMTAAEAATAGIGGIEIRTGTLAQPCATTCQTIAAPTTDFTTSTGAAYAIASAGADRRGAVNKFGTLQKDCAATASDNDKIDAQNCRAFDTPATASTFSATSLNVLYDSRFNTGTVETNYFDDLIVWGTRQQL